MNCLESWSSKDLAPIEQDSVWHAFLFLHVFHSISMGKEKN